MHSCPVCQSDQVIFSGNPRFHVDGRPTAMCPHAEAHARAGCGPYPVHYFADTGEAVRTVKRHPWELLYSAGNPADINEAGRRFAGTFLQEFCGVVGLTKAVVDELSADPELAPHLPKPKVMAAADQEGWPVMMAPLYGKEGHVGLEIRSFSPAGKPRPGETENRGPGRIVRTIGQRGLYLTDPYGSPRCIVVFEGIWDAISARYDAFENQNGEFVFGGMTANSSAEVIRGTLKRFFPNVPVIVLPDRDRPGVQAMARLRRVFPGVVLQGLNDQNGRGPKDYREAPLERRWPALLSAVEEGLMEWERRRLGDDPLGRSIIAVKPPEHEMVKDAIAALARKGGYYLRGQHMAYVWKHRGQKRSDGVPGIPAGSPVIREATPHWTREHLSQCVRFVKENSDGTTRDCLVPDWLCLMVLASSKLQMLPALQALVEVPVILPDGSILDEPGLDPETGVFYAPHRSYPEMPDCPSHEDAKIAAQRLCYLVADFPFAERPSPEAHRAAWLAFLLTGFARFAIQGPVPFVLLEANGQAAGKGLLAQLTGRLILGRSLPVGVAPSDGEELQKLAFSFLREGLRLALLDEAPSPFGSRQWNALITAYPTYEGRILGQSTTMRVPQVAIWVVTGNNVALTSDCVRRCLHIRLEPLDERPEDRQGFQIPDLLGHVHRNHAELVRDVLTILRAYVVAGRPAFDLKPWGSFQEWSDLVRNAVFWVLGVDCDTREALAERADSTRAAHSALIHELREHFELLPFTTEQVLDLYITRDPRHTALIEVIDELNVNPKGLSSRSLGRILLRAIGAVHGGSRLDIQKAKRAGSRVWIIRKVGVPAPPRDGFEGIGGSFPRTEGQDLPP
jgi:hypothetical protein